MENKKKSNILYKLIVLLVVAVIIIVATIFTSKFFSNKSVSNKNSINNIHESALGYETFKNIENNNIKLSCNDAKRLGSLFIQINNELNELSSEENIPEEQIAEYAISSPAKKEIYDFTSNFVSFLESFYSEDEKGHAEAVLQAINTEIYTNIAQISILIELGNISEKEFDDYLNIEYCGLTPPATYISPKDIAIYSINNSIGREALEGLLDDNLKE